MQTPNKNNVMYKMNVKQLIIVAMFHELLLNVHTGKHKHRNSSQKIQIRSRSFMVPVWLTNYKQILLSFWLSLCFIVYFFYTFNDL